LIDGTKEAYKTQIQKFGLRMKTILLQQIAHMSLTFCEMTDQANA
jgi:hypothetical protein